jgi:hypothetical protein
MAYPPVGGLDALGLEHCIIEREDGIYADPTALGQTFLAAFEHVMRGNFYFTDIDYALLLKAVYDVGPAVAANSLLRFASGVAGFEAARRALYKAVKVVDGQAQYQFEPTTESGGAALTVDEFVTHMWQKGVRFGLDLDAVRAAISSGSTEAVTVARRLPPQPGVDASIVEVSAEIHRNDAPRQLANGKLDLMAFQNRFPQIKAGARLLQKLRGTPGTAGFEVTGARIAPPPPGDVDLGAMVGEGTAIESGPDGEFLVASRTGYLDVDPATGKISIGDKIISRDGVSSRTTGNLQLQGDYEEFGEVQELRVIEGEGITIHGDVYGHIVSRGGEVVLNRNLVGGTAHNAAGLIRVAGMASNAVIQSRQGDVVMARADNCVISGNRVRVEHAVNCEIMADEVRLGRAEGCAIAARRVIAESAAPRKQSEMVVYALRPDSAELDKVIGLMTARVAQLADLVLDLRAEVEELTAAPEVRRYVSLASRVRKKELVLTPEQLPQFQKLALAVGPALKAIAKAQQDVKTAETDRDAGQALVEQLQEQRRGCDTAAQVEITTVEGDTTVRILTFNPDGTVPHDLPAKDIKLRLRANDVKGELIFSGSEGAVSWNS